MAWDKNADDTVNEGDSLVRIEASGEWIQIESATEGVLLKVLGAGNYILLFRLSRVCRTMLVRRDFSAVWNRGYRIENRFAAAGQRYC